MGRHTISNDVAVLVFGDCEQRRPLDEVLHVIIDVVVFCERVEVGQIHAQEVRRSHRPQRGHICDVVAIFCVYVQNPLQSRCRFGHFVLLEGCPAGTRDPIQIHVRASRERAAAACHFKVTVIPFVIDWADL